MVSFNAQNDTIFDGFLQYKIKKVNYKLPKIIQNKPLKRGDFIIAFLFFFVNRFLAYIVFIFLEQHNILCNMQFFPIFVTVKK